MTTPSSLPAPAPEPEEDAFQLLLNKVNERADLLDRLYEPLWGTASEGFNSLTQLAGGALVISISIVQLLGEKLANPTAGVLLPISWVMLAFTLLFTQYHRGTISRVRTYRIVLFEAGTTALEAQGTVKDADAAAQAAYSHLAERIGKLSTTLTRLETTIGICFLIGFVALMLFALLNLPF
jgi:hypothetical protein